MQPRRDRALSSTSGRVALRFCVRLALLIALAGLAQAGFRTAIPGFLITAGIFCACWALFGTLPGVPTGKLVLALKAGHQVPGRR
jgi:hypothetical protein